MNIYEKYKYIEGTDADGWTYQIVKSIEDLKKEAEERDNWFYSLRYDKKIASGKNLIVVATKPDGTRIDMELKFRKDGISYIEQAYYKGRFWLTMGDYYHLHLWIISLDNLRVDKPIK